MTFDFIEDADLKAKAIEEYNASVAGLKTKNEELITEKRTIQDKLKLFDGIDDSAAAIEALKFVRENEQARLIQEGKFEEVIEKRVSQIRADAMAKVDELALKLEATANEATLFKNKYNSKTIEDILREAAVTAGVRASTVTDVLLRGRMEFNLAEDGVSIEARDVKGQLRKNEAGLVLSPQVWLDGLKSTSPHYWEGSEGAGFTGKGVSTTDLMARMNELLDKGDFAGWKKLREQSLAQ